MTPHQVFIRDPAGIRIKTACNVVRTETFIHSMDIFRSHSMHTSDVTYYSFEAKLAAAAAENNRPNVLHIQFTSSSNALAPSKPTVLVVVWDISFGVDFYALRGTRASLSSEIMIFLDSIAATAAIAWNRQTHLLAPSNDNKAAGHLVPFLRSLAVYVASPEMHYGAAASWTVLCTTDRLYYCVYCMCCDRKNK